MELQNSNNKFLSAVIILAALFFVVFVSAKIYRTYTENKDYQTEITTKIEKSQQELAKLNDLKTSLASNLNEDAIKIGQFSKEFSSKDIFNYIYSYAYGVNTTQNGETIAMRGINISEPTVSDIGMNEVQIELSARFSSQKTFLKFLNFLTNPEANFSFYIDRLSYPWFGADSWGFQASIPLKMYYK